MLLIHSRRAARETLDGHLVPLADQDRRLWDGTLIAEGQAIVRHCLQLYDQLLALTPSPIVALNRAVAVAELEGPSVALVLVEQLDLPGYHLFHAIRADLLRRLGRTAEAARAYETAIACTSNQAERNFLQRRLHGLRWGERSGATQQGGNRCRRS
jgi:RNA polymerase sigma-70 factor (ECF subfamily)